MTRRTLILALAAVTLGVTCWRLIALAGTEPRYDQAFFAWWIRLLADSDHVLPTGHAEVGWVRALMSDDGSLLHNLLRNLYNKPTSVFTLIPVGLIGTLAKFAPSYEAQTIASIVWSGLTLPILGSFGWWGRGAGPTRHGAALVAMGLAALNPTLFWVSPLGIHNFGMVGLLAALAATEARLGRLARREHAATGGEFSLHFLAYFSHWTNVFLLPIAALGARLWAAAPERRLAAGLGYAPILAMVGTCLLPFVALEFLRPAEDRTHSLLTIARLTTDSGTGSILNAAAEGCRTWLVAGTESLGWPGLIGALAGLVLLWRRGIRSPALLVAIHFALFVAMSGFSGASQRVFPYIIAPLCLGLAELLSGLFIWRRLAAIILALVVAAPSASALLTERRMAEARPEFWRFYYQGQGELRPMIAEMERRIPPDGILLTWSYGVHMVHGALRNGPPIPVALDGLWVRHGQGRLKTYLADRPPLRAGRIFLATEDAEIAALSPPMEQILTVVLGREGLNLRRHPRLESVARWPLSGSSPGDITLWEVIEGHGG